MDEKQVIHLWDTICQDKEYFETFKHARIIADNSFNGEIQYGSPCTEVQAIGRWCQIFWEALPDSNSIRTGSFWTICDIAEYYCFGQSDDE